MAQALGAEPGTSRGCASAHCPSQLPFRGPWSQRGWPVPGRVSRQTVCRTGKLDTCAGGSWCSTALHTGWGPGQWACTTADKLAVTTCRSQTPPCRRPVWSARPAPPSGTCRSVRGAPGEAPVLEGPQGTGQLCLALSSLQPRHTCLGTEAGTAVQPWELPGRLRGAQCWGCRSAASSCVHIRPPHCRRLLVPHPIPSQTEAKAGVRGPDVGVRRGREWQVVPGLPGGHQVWGSLSTPME